jgi:ribonuclease P protein component
MINTIKKRSEFIKIKNEGVSVKTKSLVVLCIKVSEKEGVGFTASKRVGCSVLRNKAKRRLRHLVREYESMFPEGLSFVFIANFRTPIIDFQELRSDFMYAVTKSIKLVRNDNN